MLITILLFLLTLAPAWSAPPTPQSHFGHAIGEDRKLLDWDKVVSYFRALEKTSDRLRFKEIGKTTEGRPMIAAIIAAPETLRDLDRYLSIQQKLADPRRTTDAEAEKLIADGKSVVMITCSIHSTEVASTHTAVEFAYRLLTEDRSKFRAILANTIFILVPSLNPDGVDIVTQWYRKTLGTPYEGSGPPELYQKYVGHDNNRDWYMFSQAETRDVVGQLHNVWHPQIVYDVHQQGPYASRIFVPPWMDPIDPNVDPIIAQWSNLIGMGMAADLTSAGKKGVAVNAMYDFWSPARHYQAYHGGMRILSESASARLASPLTVTPEQIQANALGYNPREQSWNYLEPWMGGVWRIRDIIDYQLIGLESCLYQAALRREDLLRSFYRSGRKAIERRTPYSFVIPGDQFDPGSAKKMLETLQFGMVEIDKVSAPFEADGKLYAAGSYVIRMQQPYSSYAKTLLERQNYPDLRLYPGGPPKRPYDVTAQTLPLLMGVSVDTVKDAFQATGEPAKEFAFRLGGPKPSTGGLASSDIETWRAVNRIWKNGGSIARDAATGHIYPARNVAGGFPVLKKPRTAIYKSYVPSMDEGWTRWVFEQFGFEYTTVHNKDILSGGLRERFDVILFADQQPAAIQAGHAGGTMPEEFTGGLGDRGAEELKKFVNEGGTAIFLNHATGYALDKLGVKAKNVLSGVSNREFYCPGSLLNVTLESSPVNLGLPREIAIWSEGSPAWQTEDGFHGTVLARYPESKVLASGWLLGEKLVAGRIAALDADVGSGHVILFGMRPQYRAQSYQTFKMLFNALVR